jgi:hypothetical protein
LHAYLDEAEPCLADEISLAVRRSRELTVGVFHERLTTALLDDQDPKEISRQADEEEAKRQILMSAADRVAGFRRAPAETTAPDSFAIRRDVPQGPKEWWATLVGRPTRTVRILDGELSHRVLRRLSEFPPEIPIQIVTWAEPLSSSLVTAFGKDLAELRASRAGAVTVLVPVSERAGKTFPSGSLVAVDSGVYLLDKPLLVALTAQEDVQVQGTTEDAEFVQLWSGARSDYRVVAL